jgi:hypothetical protein
MTPVFTAAGRIALACCAAAAMLSPLPTQAEDSSVKRKLDSAGVKYEVDKDGDYKITFTFDDKRSQIVFVNGQPDTIDNLVMRKVYAPAAKVDEDGVGGKALDLLRDSHLYKAGNWEVEGNYLLFTVKLDDAADAQQLAKAVKLAAAAADTEEKELSGNRDTF